MFSRNFSRGKSHTFTRSFGRPKQGGSRRNGRGRAFRGSTIHHSKFIQKAQPVEEVKEFVPTHKFDDFAIDVRIKNNIKKKGYVQPTPIQDQCIPIVLEHKDLVGVANTGTGKTAAFLVPLLNKVIHDRTQKVIVMAPTRELATQIHQELLSFSFGMGVQSVLVIGGSHMGAQIRSLRFPHHFVIGTPGRIKDLLTRKILRLEQFSNVVLDEADRMLDMGFIHDITFILGRLPEKRQSLCFSATISPEIRTLIDRFLKTPATVSVKQRETAANVDQNVVNVKPGQNKIDVLTELLKQPAFHKVLIFGRTKHGVEKLSEILTKRGFAAVSIHGNKSQSARISALNLFKTHKAKILVATDVMARGLDIPNVSHVINYDQPATYDDYVHRIGRTGRAAARGHALTFV